MQKNTERVRKKILELFESWSGGVRKNRSSFGMYVLRHDRTLHTELRKNPRIFASLSRVLRNAWRGKHEQPLGKKTLRKYLPRITERFMMRPPDETSTFDKYLNAVLEKCRTEAELAQYLQEDS